MLDKATVSNDRRWPGHPPEAAPSPEDRDQIVRTATRLMRGEIDPIKDVATAPFVAVSPGDSILPESRLQFLNRYWRELPRVGDLPNSDGIDPISLKSALGYLMILEPVGDETDFLYRLYGTAIAIAAGQDWTGWTVRGMCRRMGSPYGDFYRSAYLAALVSRQLIYTEHYSPDHLAAIGWRRLILPFQDSDGRVRRLLVGNIPIGKQMLQAEQIERQTRAYQ